MSLGVSSIPAFGKNPVVRGSHALTFSEEWESVRGLYQASHVPPSQIGSDEKGRILWKTSIGDMWLPPGAPKSNFVGMLSAEMRANTYSLSAEDKVLLDCGANVGFFSRYAFMRGAECVIAFEPSPGNAACLRKNLAAELADGKLTLIEKGVWDRETTLSFSAGNASNPGSHHVSEDGREGDIRIPVTTVDSVIEQVGLKKLDYIKMDVEGAEVHGLRGAERTIRALLPRLCVATEHTNDLFVNALAVIDSVKEMDSSYARNRTAMKALRMAGC